MVLTRTLQADREFLLDLLRRGSVLEALRGNTLHREELERCLDISSATCYRYTNWLKENGLVEETEELALTVMGDVIATEFSSFERRVRRTLQGTSETGDALGEVIKLGPGLQALSNRPLDRRELEERIGVSKTTGYRITRTLENRGLIERSNRTYAPTAAGTNILNAVSRFEANVRRAVDLAPVLPVLRETRAPVDLDAFADATVTSVHGYVHSPQNRFLELLDQTETLRGLTVSDIAPFYLAEIQERLADGMVLEHILRPEFAAQQLGEFPDRAIEVCDSDNVTVYLHGDLWFSLIIFDDRIGIGVRDPDTSALQAFVDTASPEAKTWAEAVYEDYRAEAVLMPRFDPISLQQALADASLVGTDVSNG